jgi:predicted regulator of Ras-like GTPase activity (Roadblock/LC7/MglB family)
MTVTNGAATHVAHAVRPTAVGQLDWLLAEFVRGTPGVIHALVVSGDGLRLAASAQVDQVLGDQLSAATSGLVSLARGAARLLRAEPVTQTIVEMAGGYLFATAVSAGSTLTVFASRRCDMGMVGYEMTMLAARVGHILTPAPRPRQRGTDL